MMMKTMEKMILMSLIHLNDQLDLKKAFIN